MKDRIIIWILAVGVFGIMNTEMGITGILPLIADQYEVSITQAGQLISVFALVVAIVGPILPVLFSGIDRKKLMLLSLSVFIIGNIISVVATSFTLALVARILPAFFHPVYCSLALSFAAASGDSKESRKAISTVIMGVSAGMVLGVPITSFIADIASVQASMVFATLINVLAFFATLVLVPSLPVIKKQSYGTQLSIMKKPVVWLSIATIIFLAAAVGGTNSYTSEYLSSVTHISGQKLSGVLLLYGLASIFGNIIAGKLISRNAKKTAFLFPIVMSLVFFSWLLAGTSMFAMILIITVFGLMFSVQNNLNQYWITSSALEAPDFANGLFVSASNWGISLGTAIGGMVLAGLGISYIVWSGICFLGLAWITIILRNWKFNIA